MTRLAYTPMNDAIFKMIFGDGRYIDILTDFLKATLGLPAEDYAEGTLVDPHLARELPGDKLGILDIVRREVAQIIVSQWGCSPRRNLIFRYQ